MQIGVLMLKMSSSYETTMIMGSRSTMLLDLEAKHPWRSWGTFAWPEGEDHGSFRVDWGAWAHWSWHHGLWGHWFEWAV